MPYAALKHCAESRCPALVRGQARCPQHTKAKEQARGSSTERGFNYLWQQFRLTWLQRFPLCGMRADGQVHTEHSVCAQQNRTTIATCIDHSDGHSRPDDRETFMQPERLESMCGTCHRIKTIRFETGFGR